MSAWGGGCTWSAPNHRRRNVQAEALPRPLPGGDRTRRPRGAWLHRVLRHDGRVNAAAGERPDDCFHPRGPKGAGNPMSPFFALMHSHTCAHTNRHTQIRMHARWCRDTTFSRMHPKGGGEMHRRMETNFCFSPPHLSPHPPQPQTSASKTPHTLNPPRVRRRRPTLRYWCMPRRRGRRRRMRRR